jgi:hypothetical protein
MAPSIRKKLALTSLTSDGRPVGIVRLRTEATELLLSQIIHQERCTAEDWLPLRLMNGHVTEVGLRH